ncbi:hypothetical protein CEUSTIGMA_g5335.t1 [Chlamydomonas eustigma]|uniref:Agmatinase n=1 Tax=Chlamydomonas eustigma TaxID=1157962 RepID=A0A250X484_9CHLO|nr:hypothetical protein CEUSTIGMA_g5335.t1 [Chlamydomonas eustigma]|eukprot:GAX77893.1 hypothetical protein CEUSTIGMA_g5335.t1 [Chlamydomonas eustigma]
MFHSEANNTCGELGFDLAENILDFGDVTPKIPDKEGMLEAVQPIIKKMMSEQRLRSLSLGGDHSITYPLCKAVREQIGRPFTIVHFDAHPDIYPLFDNNLSSHASPFARICEEPDLCTKLISIGIRTATQEQRQQIQKYGVEVIEARHFPAHGSDVGRRLRELIQDDSLVYISFDMDALDPSAAPGVSHQEPGGLSTRQAIDAIHAIPGIIIGADLVELNPDLDCQLMTSRVASKIMKEIASVIVRSNM